MLTRPRVYLQKWVAEIKEKYKEPIDRGDKALKG
jgi:hypothetical protein